MLRGVPYERSAALYDLIYGDKAYAEEAEAVRAIVERERPAARTLLEVGCGTGGHLVFLREHFECEGVDLTPGMLERAREKLPGVPLHLGDMRSFALPRTFDAITSLFSAIGYVRSLEELDAAIACMARHLAPGGVLIVEPWFTPEQWRPGSNVYGKLHVDRDDMKLARFVVSERRGRFAVTPMHHLVATLEGVEHFVETHELFLAETHEYSAAFEKAGLSRVRHEPDVLVRGAWIGVKC
jgi:ubiquinone/menaquinone biosynthesis C-methylase UbiE